MNRKEMRRLITDRLSMRLGEGYRISVGPFLKTNVKREGLLILKDGDGISPVVYLDSFYEDLQNGASVDEILRIFHSVPIPSDFTDAASVPDFSRMRDRLFVRLVNRHLNTELLRNVPHAHFLDDFAITVYGLLGTAADGIASFTVYNSHLELWGTSADTLLSLARKNTADLFGAEIVSMTEVIGTLSHERDFPVMNGIPLPIWVMTNRMKFQGAAAILTDGILEKYAREHGDFYVIFSSVHEVLLIPAEPGMNTARLSEMNRQVNAEQLQKEDILGTKAYFYSRDRGFVF